MKELSVPAQWFYSLSSEQSHALLVPTFAIAQPSAGLMAAEDSHHGPKLQCEPDEALLRQERNAK